MIDSFKKLKESIFDYPHYNLSRITEKNIQDSTIKVLGVRDLGQLKDKYEGQAFLDNTIKKVGAYLACLDSFDLPKSSINEDFIKNFKPIIKTNNETFVIVIMDFNNLPLLKLTEFKAKRIFVIHKGAKQFCVVGIANLDVLNDKNNFQLSNQTEGYFKAFNKLELINKKD